MNREEMLSFDSLEEIDNFIKDGEIALLYLSRPACGVCNALLPKVTDMINTNYPKIKMSYVDMDKIEESAGHFSVFTIPAIIIYVDGKEFIREARYISVEKLEQDIKRIYNMYHN